MARASPCKTRWYLNLRHWGRSIKAVRPIRDGFTASLTREPMALTASFPEQLRTGSGVATADLDLGRRIWRLLEFPAHLFPSTGPWRGRRWLHSLSVVTLAKTALLVSSSESLCLVKCLTTDQNYHPRQLLALLGQLIELNRCTCFLAVFWKWFFLD